MTTSDDPTIQHLIHWAEQQPLVRAMILTSTRAVTGSASDLFSDYDVILALSDIHPYHESREWLEEFGPVLVLYRDPIELDHSYKSSGYVVQYENGLKIDFSLCEVEILRYIAREPQLPVEYDAGYQVLLDKDHLTDGLQPPTFRGYIPNPPTETEYLNAIEEFFLDAIYAAKYLWRDDLIAAKFLIDNLMKQEYLRPMLEWHIEIEHQWSVKPGPYGRRLKKWLRPDLWTGLEETYSGAGIAENWEALDRTITLFRKVANEVGSRLGFPYPTEMDSRVMIYLQKVKNLNPDARSFS